jgi:large conductance mechanosensitive channel
MFMGLLTEFKEFALRGNVIDLAIGVVIGGAFGKIVTSLVNDLIMPSISYMIGTSSFKNLSVILHPAVFDGDGKESIPALLLNYGIFIQTVIDFTMITFAIFMVVKTINKLRRIQDVPVETPAPSGEIKLLTEIRDVLKQQKP